MPAWRKRIARTARTTPDLRRSEAGQGTMSIEMGDQHQRNLTAALGLLQLPPRAPELRFEDEPASRRTS
jgi:hypothetical protein